MSKRDAVAIAQEYLEFVLKSSLTSLDEESLKKMPELLLWNDGPFPVVPRNMFQRTRGLFEEAVKIAQADPFFADMIWKLHWKDLSSKLPRRARKIVAKDFEDANPFLWATKYGPPTEEQLRTAIAIFERFNREDDFAMRWREQISSELSTNAQSDLGVWETPWIPHFANPSEFFIRNSESWAVWFIGLPGSGKSTLASSLYLFFVGLVSSPLVVMIDGDMTRSPKKILIPSNGLMCTIGGDGNKGRDFTRETRLQNAEGFARWFVAQLARTPDYPGTVLVGSTFCPFVEQRQALDEAFCGRVMFVYVNTPREVCEKRRVDVGCYTDPEKDPGISTFEVPDADSAIPAALTIDTSVEPLHRSIERIVGALEERTWLVRSDKQTVVTAPF